MMNGGTGPNSFDPDMSTNKMELYKTSKNATWLSNFFVRFCQTLCIVDNFNISRNGVALTSNQINDIV
jgi:hypothetical protein